MSRIIKRISVILFILSIFAAGYIMLNHMGLDDGLDFGAGAYYYADIPEFDKYINGEAYESPVSFCVIAILFLVWGLIVYRFWLWIDKR